jgi:uncharacterized protein YjdB
MRVESIMKKITYTLLITMLISMFTSVFSASAASTFNIKEDTTLAKEVQDFTAIKQMFTDKADITAIKAKYVSAFQPQVKAVDATITAGPKIDENISFVLDATIANKLNYGQAQQAVDKGLQWYFYVSLKNYAGNLGAIAKLTAKDQAGAKVDLEKAIQIYENVVAPTMIKRDNTFKTDMKGLLDKVVVPQLIKDIESNDLTSYKVHYQMLDKTIVKMFVLAIMTYAKNTPTKAAADQPAAMTEGYFFYLPIFASLSGGSAKDAQYIADVWASGDAKQIQLAKIQAAFEKSIHGKITAYAKKTLDALATNDASAAQVNAMEGAMFVAVFETFKPAVYAKLSDAATTWIEFITGIVSVETITIMNGTSLTLVKGKTAFLKVSILPLQATNRKFTHSTSNAKVAIVNAAGKITALKPGKAIITVKAVDGDLTAQMQVTVK